MSEIMNNIDNRVKGLNSKPQSNINFTTVYESVMKSYTLGKAIQLFNNWHPSIMSFESVMEVFDIACEKGKPHEIIGLTNLIENNIIPKVRDGQSTANYIKRKMGRIKTKISTKINNNIDSIKHVVPDTIDTAKQNLKNNIQGDKQQDSNTKPINDPKNKDTVAELCLNRLYETMNMYRQCDRILDNYNRISKRYNIDNYIIENTVNRNDMRECVYGLCEFIDTYKMDLKVKYNTALETINYAFNKLHIHYDESSSILEDVTTYFLMRNPSISKEDINSMKYIIENSKVLSPFDIMDEDINYLYEQNKTNVQESVNADDNMFSYTMNDDIALESYINSIVQEDAKETAKELINKFKLKEVKTPELLKNLVISLYTRSSDNIIEELPNLLSIIRVFFILGAFAIYPVLGVVTLIADYAIKMTLQRKECDKMVTSYKKERDKAERKLEKLKSEDSKTRMTDYIKTLDKSIVKLEDYRDSLYSDEELEKRDEEEFKLEGTLLDQCSTLVAMSTLVEEVQDLDFDKIINKVSPYINEFTLDDIDTFVENSILYLNRSNSSKLQHILQENLQDLRKNSSYDKYVRIDCLNENLNILRQGVIITESTNNDLGINESLMKMVIASEFTKLQNNLLLEMNVVNTFKLAMEKLKKKTKDLSDKEKILSRTIDASMSTLKNNAEAAITNDNREAVIRGSILPSASKIIKAAITTGAAWLINPALAAIGLLGYIGASKALQAKERQLILDDIDTELVMVEKYIRIAEDKQDMKALRSLLQTQKALNRQKNRLRFKMVHTNQKVPTTTKDMD